METRSEKYSSNSGTSRTQRNKELYRDLYKDTNYSNMVVIDDSNEIDINKIKEILNEDKKPSKETKKEFFESLKNYYGITEDTEEKIKSYDINEVLKEAKNKRDIIEEANEKRKIENYKFRSNLDLENELEKTRKVYSDLVKEENELLNIMNTLTNISPQNANGQKNLDNTTSMALDLLEDFKEEPTRKLSDSQVLNVKQVDDDSREYSTDTFMFATKDFEGLKNQIKQSNGFVKVLIVIFTLLIIVGCYFIIFKFIMN